MSEEDVSEVSVLVAHEPEDFTARAFEEDNKVQRIECERSREHVADRRCLAKRVPQVTVNTRCGEISAIVSGDPSSQPSIVTYHDIGLTCTRGWVITRSKPLTF